MEEDRSALQRDVESTSNPNNGDDDAEEEELTRQMRDNKTQLTFILEQLAIDPENLELLQLRSSLEELGALLEVELVEIKKRKLLSQLAQHQENGSAIFINDRVENDVHKNSIQENFATAENCDIISSYTNDDDDDFTINEYSVPFTNSPLTEHYKYHDAIVKKREDGKLVAFFLYPTIESMRTCPHYLQGVCKYADDDDDDDDEDEALSRKCRYSHGYLVTRSSLRPKLAISLDEDRDDEHNEKSCVPSSNGSCLIHHSSITSTAKTEFSPSTSATSFDSSENDLWSHARVVKIDDEKERVLVCIEATRKDFWINLDDDRLVMLRDDDEDESLDPIHANDDDDEDINEDFRKDYDNYDDDDDENVISSSATSSSFGEWERYTKGMGSKLMAKMGYRPGDGLGTAGQGRVHPIETHVFPAGKSLDTCFALQRESNQKKLDIGQILREQRRKRRVEARRREEYRRLDKVMAENGANKRKQSQMFSIVNNLFLGKHRSKHSAKTKVEIKCSTSSANLAQLDAKSLNISSFKLDESLRKSQTELRKTRETLRRNLGKLDRRTAEKLEQKCAKQVTQVEAIERQLALIAREKTIRKEGNKLRIF